MNFDTYLFEISASPIKFSINHPTKSDVSIDLFSVSNLRQFTITDVPLIKQAKTI